ncbi:hypothetical protein LCGC14_2589080 [marine sediment metagenome]|uniref:dATP/dGTP diphosphohydrolase N-terminal domain-containing protein n=1 Tax=marine sediment metagenome TaxID=412755 RepID=A0A0F9ACG8_9ZZZZ
MYNHVEDSGKRQEFNTGSVRDTRAGKGRFDLVPGYALFRLAQHYENGAAKYGDRNWERGQPLSRYLSSAIRHLVEYGMGMREEDHLAAVAWNAFSIIWTEEQVRLGKLPQELDDMNVVAVESKAGPIRMGSEPTASNYTYEDIQRQWATRIRRKREEELVMSRYVPLPPDEPRTLWQRFLRRIGL